MNERKEFIIQIKPLKESLKDFAKVWEKLERGEKVKPVRKLTFVDMNVFRTFATEKRIELLKIIKENKPQSIKELERLTKRDYKSINTDLEVLKKMNLVEIKKKNHKVIPNVRYKEISIKIPLGV